MNTQQYQRNAQQNSASAQPCLQNIAQAVGNALLLIKQAIALF